MASFHTIIYAYGRNVYSLSRAGYYPHWLSLTHGKRKTPSSPCSAVACSATDSRTCSTRRQPRLLGGNLSAALLSMAVFGARHLLLHADAVVHPAAAEDAQHRAALPQPAGRGRRRGGRGHRAVALAALFVREDYRPGVYGVAAWFLLAILYFALVGRHKLILSPEEEFALTRGEHGHPEREGYGQTQVADVTVRPPRTGTWSRPLSAR